MTLKEEQIVYILLKTVNQPGIIVVSDMISRMPVVTYEDYKYEVLYFTKDFGEDSYKRSPQAWLFKIDWSWSILSPRMVYGKAELEIRQSRLVYECHEFKPVPNYQVGQSLWDDYSSM